VNSRISTPGAISEDARLASDLAVGAGAVLLELRARIDAGLLDADAASLRRIADDASQRYLEAAIRTARPDDAILSEEALDDRRRLEAGRVWIIDPLDGTREFAERTDDGAWRQDFAVHVAVWHRGLGVVAGAVALPGRGTIFGSDPSATINDAGVQAVLAGQRSLRLVVSRSRPPSIVDRLGQRPDIEVIPMGSAGAKAMAVVDGSADAYVHSEGQSEWDSAAPVVVAAASGLVATRLDGTALSYNQEDPWLPDLVICHRALVPLLRQMLDEADRPIPQVAAS
jgi:3'(2'), 5'-bisphosphate nucleotidase